MPCEPPLSRFRACSEPRGQGAGRGASGTTPVADPGPEGARRALGDTPVADAGLEGRPRSPRSHPCSGRAASPSDRPKGLQSHPCRGSKPGGGPGPEQPCEPPLSRIRPRSEPRGPGREGGCSPRAHPEPSGSLPGARQETSGGPPGAFRALAGSPPGPPHPGVRGRDPPRVRRKSTESPPPGSSPGSHLEPSGDRRRGLREPSGSPGALRVPSKVAGFRGEPGAGWGQGRERRAGRRARGPCHLQPGLAHHGNVLHAGGCQPASRVPLLAFEGHSRNP